MASSTRRLGVALLACLAIAVGPGGVAYATHIFADVPTTAFYHADASWAKDQGITVGCGDFDYCPEDPVSRGQMAAFLHRMASRTRTDHFSCAGTGFIPHVGGLAVHGTAGSLRFQSFGYADCPLIVPDGAVLTKVMFAYLDNDPDGTVQGIMYRGTRGSGYAAMGGMPVSTNAASPRVAIATTVNFPVIDNVQYDYWFRAEFQGGSPDVGVLGAIVEYTTIGAPEP